MPTSKQPSVPKPGKSASLPQSMFSPAEGSKHFCCFLVFFPFRSFSCAQYLGWGCGGGYKKVQVTCIHRSCPATYLLQSLTISYTHTSYCATCFLHAEEMWGYNLLTCMQATTPRDATCRRAITLRASYMRMSCPAT